MKKLFFLLPIFLLADIDPFSAGLNSSSNPYGLSTNEKYILENKKNIEELNKKVSFLKKNFDSIKLKLLYYDEIIKEKLSAFPTLLDEINSAMRDIESLKRKIKSNEARIKSNEREIFLINKKIKNLSSQINNLQKDILSLKISIGNIVKVQNENFETLRNNILELVNEIKKITELTPKKAFLKARDLFFSNELDEAKKLFLFSLTKNYLPATSSYYLGEIAYKKGNYKEALAFYKKSVSLYPKKTSYMPKLLYHTAISFEKLGNKKAAKLTLEKLLHDFPTSKYAKLAKKELEKLK